MRTFRGSWFFSRASNQPHSPHNGSPPWILCFLLCAVLLPACGRTKGKVLGKAPSNEARSVLAIRAGDTPKAVALRGKIIEKCPVAGCWFRLQDDTGVIKVDTKAAGFVVTDVPLQTAVTVSGHVAMDGNEILLEATGLRY